MKYLYLIGVFGCIWQIFFKYTFHFYTLIHNDKYDILVYFIIHIYISDDLHNIFVMTYCANISVIDTLIHVGRIKMLHKHTHLPLCVLTACGHWTMDIETELSLMYRPRSTFIYWGLVTPQYGDKIWWQNSCHHWFRNGLSSVWCQPLPEPMLMYCQLEP